MILFLFLVFFVAKFKEVFLLRVQPHEVVQNTSIIPVVCIIVSISQRLLRAHLELLLRHRTEEQLDKQVQSLYFSGSPFTEENV